MNSVEINLPVIALRGMTILPYMVIHFDVSRKKSVKSIEYAMKNGQKIFLVSQKSQDTVDPAREDIYDYGTVCLIKQIVKMPGGLIRVVVSGLTRARLLNFTQEEEMLAGNISEPIEEDESAMSDIEKAAPIGMLKALMEQYYEETGRNHGDNITRLKAITNLDELIYTALADMTTECDERQPVLNMDSMEDRYNAVCDMAYSEINIAKLKVKLTEKMRQRVDKNQKDYILREQIHVIREELGEENYEQEADEYRQRVQDLNASAEVKNKIYKEISRYESSSGSSSEAAVIRTYIDTMLELPWNNMTDDNYDIENAAKILNRDHYGLKDVKERILEFLAVRSLTGKGESPVICLVGPPGTGKTSIARSVAEAVGRKYVRVCLGGVRDEAEIRGHRKTYIGAMPGRIITGLIQAESGNPLMLLDEIDKVGNDARGDTASALLEVLDSAQNSAFRDHYIEVPVDLSQVLFIATANDTGTIPKPLLDRMEIIELNSYTQVEKFHIAKEHLVAKQLKKNGLKKSQVSLSDSALNAIIEGYTREAGVRELERKIGAVCRKAAVKIVSGEKTTHRISSKNIEDYLGVRKYEDETPERKNRTGIVHGLAWTSVGGTLLDIEAVTMKGKGNLNLTGSLGDVMKESAQVAFGYVKANAEKYKIKSDIFEKTDISVHAPEGAVPKDGPSAGVTMTLAMISALSGRKVKADVAMTGEMTLHGDVLPIGGLKEKLLAAQKSGMKTVIVPEKNRKDVSETDPEITQNLEIVYAKKFDDVADHALCE